MLPDWVSNPGPLTYESGALPIALRGTAVTVNDRGWYYLRMVYFSSVILSGVSSLCLWCLVTLKNR